MTRGDSDREKMNNRKSMERGERQQREKGKEIKRKNRSRDR